MRKLVISIFMLLFTTVVLAAQQNVGEGKMELTSPAFRNGEYIPEKYGCNGQDVSPPFQWQNAPKATKSFVLIVHDPDAQIKGGWYHWILFNIPANITQLPENLQRLPMGTKEAINSWGREGYGGPCPPDKMHHYTFKLFALDSLLSLSSKAKKADVEKAMKNHILGQAELVGKYQPKH